MKMMWHRRLESRGKDIQVLRVCVDVCMRCMCILLTEFGFGFQDTFMYILTSQSD